MSQILLHFERYRIPVPKSISVWVLGLIMKNWFGDAKVKQSDANTGRKQHSKVRYVAEFWFFVVFAEFHVAILWEVHDDKEDEPCILCDDVQPSEFLRYPTLAFSHFMRSTLRIHDRPNHQSPNDDRRNYGNYRIEVDSNRTERPFESTAFRSCFLHPVYFVFHLELHAQGKQRRVLLTLFTNQRCGSSKQRVFLVYISSRNH